MKPKPLALSAAIILLTSVNAYAGNGYFTEVFRNLGYFYGDGYHAQRDCLPDYKSCSDCSPVQQPMMQQPIMQQPMMQQPIMQQPMMQQPIMQQPIMQQPIVQQPMMQRPIVQQPMMAPPFTQWAPPQFQPVSSPVGYPVTQSYQPWYPSYAIGYHQPETPSVAIPNPRPALHW